MSPTAATLTDQASDEPIRRKIRLVLAVFIAGLVVSGVTAFPLLHELNLFVAVFHVEQASASGQTFSGLAAWILQVREGLAVTYAHYPFIAYGTD